MDNETVVIVTDREKKRAMQILLKDRYGVNLTGFTRDKMSVSEMQALVQFFHDLKMSDRLRRRSC